MDTIDWISLAVTVIAFSGVIFVMLCFGFAESRTGIKISDALNNLTILSQQSTAQTETKVNEKQKTKSDSEFKISLFMGVILAISVDGGFLTRLTCIIVCLLPEVIFRYLSVIPRYWHNFFLYVDTISVLLENARLSLPESKDTVIREREDKWKRSQEQWKELLVVLDEARTKGTQCSKCLPLNLSICNTENLITDENRSKLRKLKYNILYNQEKKDGSFYLSFDIRL